MARARNNKATVLGIGIVALIIGIAAFFIIGKDALAGNSIEKNGTRTEGTIVGYEDTSMEINNEEVSKIKVKYTDENGVEQIGITSEGYTISDLEGLGLAGYSKTEGFTEIYDVYVDVPVQIAYLDGEIAIIEGGSATSTLIGYGSLGLMGLGGILIVVGIIVLIKSKGKKAEETPVVSAPINVRPINGTGNPNAPRNNNGFYNGYPPQNTQNRPPARDVFEDFNNKPAQQSGPRVCSHCGTKLGTNEKFCPNCGAKND